VEPKIEKRISRSRDVLRDRSVEMEFCSEKCDKSILWISEEKYKEVGRG
jgi:hypothetical protein